MDALTFSFFTDFSHDPESKQYQLQHALTEVRRSFRKNALYPFLNQLIELRTQLNQLLAQLETFENNQPKKLIEIDLVRNELKYEPSFVDVNLQKTAMFIRQNLPLISSVIDEGAAIYDFVEQQVTMDPVGVVPTYQSEGYFLIPDHDADEVKIYRFELSH